MSEPLPVYLSCASGVTQFADLLIRRHGSLVELSGPGFVLLAPKEARAAIAQIQRILDYIDPPVADETAIIDPIDALERHPGGIYRVTRSAHCWQIERIADLPPESDSAAIEE